MPCAMDVPRNVTAATMGRQQLCPNAFHCWTRELLMSRVVAVLRRWRAWRSTMDTGEPQVAAEKSWNTTTAMPAGVG